MNVSNKNGPAQNRQADVNNVNGNKKVGWWKRLLQRFSPWTATSPGNNSVHQFPKGQMNQRGLIANPEGEEIEETKEEAEMNNLLSEVEEIKNLATRGLRSASIEATLERLREQHDKLSLGLKNEYKEKFADAKGILELCKTVYLYQDVTKAAWNFDARIRTEQPLEEVQASLKAVETAWESFQEQYNRLKENYPNYGAGGENYLEDCRKKFLSYNTLYKLNTLRFEIVRMSNARGVYGLWREGYINSKEKLSEVRDTLKNFLDEYAKISKDYPELVKEYNEVIKQNDKYAMGYEECAKEAMDIFRKWPF